MTSKRYRIYAPIDEETRRVLNRLARALGCGAGGAAGRFLDDMRPHLAMLADVVDKAKTDPSTAMANLDAFADAAVGELSKARAEHQNELAGSRKAEPAERGNRQPVGGAS